MTKIAKLRRKWLDGTQLTFTEFQRLMEAHGFRLFRTRGSHMIYGYDDIAEQLSIQPQGKDAKVYQVRQFTIIVDRYALTMDEGE